MNDIDGQRYDLVCRERDLLASLLGLLESSQVGDLLDQGLVSVLAATGARKAYLALFDPDCLEVRNPRWWVAHDLSDEDVGAIQASLSQGIIAAALDDPAVLETASAMLDPRFSARSSVRRNEIEAVLCARIGDGAGVVYLQGRVGGGGFTEGDVALLERFREHMARPVTRFLDTLESGAEDPTQAFRQGGRFSEMVGRSRALAEVLERAQRYAPLVAHVLISGPTGTGKTVLAREMHRMSGRAKGPFVEINCATLPETLVESELFGAVAGAHSTAGGRREGKVAAAEGGTLFLDEVGEIPLAAQAKLLQFVQDRVYHPLGSSRPRVADVRIIAASNRDLRREVEAGRFRDDLYHRLDVCRIAVPALAKRRADIPLLMRALGRRHADEHGLAWRGLSDAAVLEACHRAWPGHVRQLSNHVKRGVLQALGERPVSVSDIFDDVEDPEGELEALGTWEEATRMAQRAHLRRALKRNDGNVSATARSLEITRTHVYNLMQSLGVEREG